jgi:hypothetical protein
MISFAALGDFSLAILPIRKNDFIVSYLEIALLLMISFVTP